MYNAIFTNFPVIWRTVFDFDVDPSMDGAQLLPHIPYLYCAGQMRLFFNYKTYALWILHGLFHAAIVFWIPVFTF